jgi:uncharacterized protein
MTPIDQRIAAELSVHPRQVEAAVRLLDEGATVPFIARYRKEQTGALSDTQLRLLEERLGYLRELEERRQVILESVREQGKLTPELEQALLEADTKVRLEDLYLPYRPKRRTKAQIAREAGLAPLAEALLSDPTLGPEQAALAYISPDKGIADATAALEGARYILMEQFAEDAELLGRLRDYLWENARLVSKVIEGKQEAGAKFADYFDYHEPLREVPSHRALAMFRGRREGVLDLSLVVEQDQQASEQGRRSFPEVLIAQRFGIEDAILNGAQPAHRWLRDTVRLAWRAKLATHLEVELMGRLREGAEEAAIQVFARNLHDLLLAASAGPRPTLGLDPGLRTGVKVAVVDATGKLVATGTIYPHAPRNDWDGSIRVLAELAHRHGVELISVGNGTASRETDRLVADLIKRHPDLNLTKVVVSEAGASVYSASELAAQEFPDLDVSLRGAISIARRLQDPLAELVKIDPKAIGVGQYQHDVSQTRLAHTLDAVVEDCVNAVGVDLNTASVPLLARVAGVGQGLARNIVEFRHQHGAFRDRGRLRQVPRLGEKTFEQCAGFLRIANGDNPLDASAVHPEAYPVVERILAKTGRSIKALIGDGAFLRALRPAEFTDERFGLPTVIDILAELEKPGRDPRPEFRTAAFKEGVETLEDLQPDMVLEGVVTNVTHFGAFVDIGVHQDGLVHVSALAERYVKDPHSVVKPGDVVKVKVLEVDLKRRRIALTMRLAEPTHAQGRDLAPRPPQERLRQSSGQRSESRSRSRPEAPTQPQGTMAEAFAKARNKGR